MDFKNNIVSDEEKQWSAYLNGEPNITDYHGGDEKLNNDLTKIWEAMGTKYSYLSADPDKGWRKLQKQIEKSDKQLKTKEFKIRLFKYAASIVMVIGIGFAVYQFVKTPEIIAEAPVIMAFSQTSEHPEAVTTVTLPDGSKVKLNANTKIEYPEQFRHGIRKIKLSGEAFFEVTKDSLHPFRIETLNATVEVLGTSFNVSAYPNDDRVEVNVETGKVKLTSMAKGIKGTKFAVLPAGERGWLKVSEGEVGQARNLAPNYSAWINKVISFQRTPLEEVCKVLENTYHIKFRLENPEIGKIPYTANFADLNSEYVVNVIARTHHLQIKKIGDEIILTKRSN